MPIIVLVVMCMHASCTCWICGKQRNEEAQNHALYSQLVWVCHDKNGRLPWSKYIANTLKWSPNTSNCFEPLGSLVVRDKI